MLRSLLVIAIGIWAGQAVAETPTILVLGDSLSAGYGISTHQGWVALLQRRLKQQGYPYQVINASISGDTTSAGLTRLPQALAQHRPHVVIVELGGNDGLRGLPLDDMQRNLVSIIKTSRDHGAKVLLVGVRLPPNYGATYVQKFHDVYRSVGTNQRVPLVPYLLDGVGGNDELMQSDRLHPGASAQGRMLENVWPHLLAILEQLTLSLNDTHARRGTPPPSPGNSTFRAVQPAKLVPFQLLRPASRLVQLWTIMQSRPSM